MAEVLSRRERFMAFLTLIRVPNYFTVFAEPWVGYLLSGGTAVLPLVLMPVCVILVYAMAILLNDVADYEEDLRERPQRPLPSGIFSKRFAVLFAILFGGLSVVCAGFLVMEVLVVDIGLILLCVGYNFCFKHYAFLSELTLVFARLGAIAMGVAAMPDSFLNSPEKVLIFPVFATVLYIFGVSRLARDETRLRPHFFGRMLVLMGISIPSAAFVYLTFQPGFTMNFNAALLLGLALMILIRGFKCFIVMSAIVVDVEELQREIGRLLGMLVLFQGAWLCLNPTLTAVILAALVALTYVPFNFLARRFPPS